MIEKPDRQDNTNSIIACYYNRNQKVQYFYIHILSWNRGQELSDCMHVDAKEVSYECLRNSVGHTSRNRVVVHDW
jgi:hypothetical protein